MTIKTLFLLTFLILLNSNETIVPNQETLFSDTDAFISKTSKEIIDLVNIDLQNEQYKIVWRDTTYNFEYIGTITFKEDCCLDWNDGSKPVFIPRTARPPHSDSAKWRCHLLGDTVEYRGFTTYRLKNGKWGVLAM